MATTKFNAAADQRNRMYDHARSKEQRAQAAHDSSQDPEHNLRARQRNEQNELNDKLTGEVSTLEARHRAERQPWSRIGGAAVATPAAQARGKKEIESLTRDHRERRGALAEKHSRELTYLRSRNPAA
jgi:hypothetical protein